MTHRSGTAIFLETSIQIARVVHSEATQRRIAETIRAYDARVSSDVVKQEYKRRLLEEVQWCLNQLNDPRRPKTFEELFRHVTDIIPVQQKNKKNICIQLCHTVLAVQARGDLTERARRHFRTLLRTGMALFESGLDLTVRESGCACAAHPITEDKVRKQFDFGPQECSQCRDRCGIARLIENSAEELALIRDGLGELPGSLKQSADGKATELGKIELFLSRVMDRLEDPRGLNPCLTVGDLLIALESKSIPDFYTMNWKESQFLCRWIGQNLVLRKVNPEHPDRHYSIDEPEWRN